MTMPLHSPFYQMESMQYSDHQGEIHLTVRPALLPQLYQLSTWIGPDAWNALVALIPTEISVPRYVGQTSYLDDGTTLIRSGPEELLFARFDQPSEQVKALIQSIDPEVGHGLELTHARCVINLSGDAATATLQKLFALDFRLNAFPLNEVKMTGAHHMPAMLLRRAENDFALLVLTSYARDWLTILTDSGREFGVKWVFGSEIEN